MLVFKPHDYLYPCDLRIDQDLLYILFSGMEGPWGERHIVVEFDLNGRRLLRHKGVKKKRLPHACE